MTVLVKIPRKHRKEYPEQMAEMNRLKRQGWKILCFKSDGTIAMYKKGITTFRRIPKNFKRQI